LKIQPIRTKADYKAALAIVSKLVDKDPAPGTPEGDQLDVLGTLIEAFEAERYAIPTPHPIELLKHKLESREHAL
jgi:HTH-type transcriptional regulator / antitoxin HigA